MFIIVGLGNPEKKYDNTRHNIGFRFIDALASKYNIEVNTLSHKALLGKGMIGANKVILAKPQTYMNLSGQSVQPLADYYKIDPETELIIVSDDIALAPGNIRVRKKGSAGGHNGLKNIIQLLGTDSFRRIRMGVGEKPKEYDLADYVLGHFSDEENKLMEEGIHKGIDALNLILQDKIDEAMNLYNRKEKSE